MANRRPLTDPDGEVRELTAEDFAAGVPFAALPDTLKSKLSGIPRGPGKEPAKRLISLRLDQDVIEHFRATGPGWQSRINEALKKSIPSRS